MAGEGEPWLPPTVEFTGAEVERLVHLLLSLWRSVPRDTADHAVVQEAYFLVIDVWERNLPPEGEPGADA